MTAPDMDPNLPQPFGAQVRRSMGPFYFFAGLYLVWFGFLVTLAVLAYKK